MARPTDTGQWHTVGKLSKQNDFYCFVYTQGAIASPRFKHLGRMHDLYQRYASQELFPLFANRVLSRSRPEYPDYVRWLAVDPAQQDDPMQLLARSGGKRLLMSYAFIRILKLSLMAKSSCSF